MSTDDLKNGQGRRTLLPEFLPAPTAGDTSTPPERVAARARLLLQRFRGLGTTAGAAVLSLQCSGYGVVDPLPPPPMTCSTSPNPFGGLLVLGSFRIGTAVPTIELSLMAPNTTGLTISSVRVAGATIIGMEDRSQSSGYFHVQIVLAADVPSVDILIEVDFACEGASRTKYYSIARPMPTGNSRPVITELPGPPADAGTD
jgi:hypothetical protein